MPQPPKVKSRRKLWRISKEAPLGEWVDARDPVTTPRGDDLPEVSDATWVSSSFDLASGVDVIEEPDTIPGELLDELFTPKSNQRKRPKS